MTALLPIAAFRVPAENMGMALGTRTVFKMLSEQPTLPSIILVEANVIVMEEEALLIKEVKAKMLLKQYQQRFRPTFMLLSEFNNLIDMALPVLEKIRGRGQGAPPPPVSLSQDAIDPIVEKRVQKEIDNDQAPVSSDYLNKVVAGIKQRIDQFIKRGAYVVLVEMPMDTRVRATPKYVSVLRAMRAAFPVDQYQWITPRLAHVETIDGVHLTPRSAQETAKVIDQTIMSLGLYLKLGLLPASDDADT